MRPINMSALQQTFLGVDSADTADVDLAGAFNSNAFYNMSLLSGSDLVDDYFFGPNQSGSGEYGFYCRNSIDVNISYLNVSCETNLKFSVPLYGYITPLLIIITLIANSLIIIVLSRRTMANSPTNLVLLMIAVCDLFTVICPGPSLFYMYTLGNHFKPLGPSIACYFYTIFNETVPAMFHTASIWLTVCLAVQRYIYVCHAPHAKSYCTMIRVRKTIGWICFLAMLHQLTRFFDTNYISTNIEWEGLNRTVCQVEIAFWISNYVGENVYFSSYFLFRVFFVHLIPCIVLVLLNMCLFRAMRNAQKKRQKLFDKCAKKSKKANDKNSTTLMLIIIVTIFLIVEIPLALITGLHVLSQLTNHFLDYRMANQFILFANFFLLVSYPINFVIYIKMSRVFRETAKMFMFWRPAPSPSGNATIGNVQSSRYSVVNGARTCTNETVL